MLCHRYMTFNKFNLKIPLKERTSGSVLSPILHLASQCGNTSGISGNGPSGDERQEPPSAKSHPKTIKEVLALVPPKMASATSTDKASKCHPPQQSQHIEEPHTGIMDAAAAQGQYPDDFSSHHLLQKFEQLLKKST